MAIDYTNVADGSVEGFTDKENKAVGVLFDPFGLPGARDLLSTQLALISELA